MKYSGFMGLKAASIVKWKVSGGTSGFNLRKKRSAGVSHTGLWGLFKNEVFISEIEEATGGCLNVWGEGRVT